MKYFSTNVCQEILAWLCLTIILHNLLFYNVLIDFFCLIRQGFLCKKSDVSDGSEISN